MSRRSMMRLIAVSGMVAVVTALAVPSGLAGAKERSARAGEEGYEQRNDIRITNDKEFDAAHGIRSGSGTVDDPYVISGWSLNRIQISDTSAALTIVDNQVRSQMVLNWTGPNLELHNNVVNDLRVNQNVRRTGDMTSGVIAHNKFGIVGQLRHFDGAFEHNVVGNANGSGQYFNRAVNFDGFNGARFSNNEIYGYVEARLHGHHHSSSFDPSNESHYHGSDPAHAHGGGEPGEGGEPMEAMDHSQRYHRVFITDNTIHSTNWAALFYTDTNHAGNDRTAASEQNPALNEPHVHHTRVYLWDNVLIGSGLGVQVFNADYNRHTGTATGLVDIRNNTIEVVRINEWHSPVTSQWNAYRGMDVETAKDVVVNISGNSITGPPGDENIVASAYPWENPTIGLILWNIDRANIFIRDMSLTRFDIGISAQSLTNTVRWVISNLKTKDVEQRIHYANAPKPEERP